MKLPASAHTSRPWRIHEIAHDFRLEDVWALPTPGGPDDFPRLLELFASFDPSRSSSAVTRVLFALREKAGEVLGWDDPAAGLGGRVASLGDRVPPDLRGSGDSAAFELPVTPLYVTRDEFAAEIANRTVHGVIHLGWVPDDDDGGYHGQIAILVKRNGLLGAAYMAAITPFRYLAVYPQLLREVGEAWRKEPSQRPAPPP